MGDKGFDIQDLLVQYGVKLNIPPMKQGRTQMVPHDIAKTKKIAAVRIHLECKMKQIKAFKLLSNILDKSILDILDPLLFVASV